MTLGKTEKTTDVQEDFGDAYSGPIGILPEDRTDQISMCWRHRRSLLVMAGEARACLVEPPSSRIVASSRVETSFREAAISACCGGGHLVNLTMHISYALHC